MLNVVFLKEEFTTKLVFLRGLKSWVQKIIYQKMEISITCYGLMKMVGCMENKGLPCPKGETKSEITQKHHASPSNGGKGCNKHN
jgi:hypothetical protein